MKKKGASLWIHLQSDFEGEVAETGIQNGKWFMKNRQWDQGNAFVGQDLYGNKGLYLRRTFGEKRALESAGRDPKIEPKEPTRSP
jgi:hypothetical protein